MQPKVLIQHVRFPPRHHVCGRDDWLLLSYWAGGCLPLVIASRKTLWRYHGHERLTPPESRYCSRPSARAPTATAPRASLWGMPLGLREGFLGEWTSNQ